MTAERLSLTTFNLLNLNEPGLPMYRDRDGWSAAQYALKIGWTGRMLRLAQADVFGFQELWHEASLQAAFEAAGLADDYRLLVPAGHAGDGIVCAGAVRHELLEGEPEWISAFPDVFHLRSQGDDPQTPAIGVEIRAFSRPVLHFRIRPRADQEPIEVFVCHFKSKAPTQVWREDWYDAATHSKHQEAFGGGLSTIRRTAETTALRVILTELMKGTSTPVIVLGDLNDGQHSNTLNILTGQPRYLTGLSTGGGDTDLYSGQTLQQYRSERDVYYTHVYQGTRESLDHILVSQEFYDNSRKRLWAFDGMDIYNDHLNREEHEETDGANDHGIVRVWFKYAPAKRPR